MALYLIDSVEVKLSGHQNDLKVFEARSKA